MDKALIQRTIIELTKDLVKEYSPLRIILFGSYAYGEPKKDSDIDLFIIKQTQERPINRRIKVRKIVSRKTNNIPFESIVLTPKELAFRIKVGDQFIQEILTKGKLLYAKS